MSITLRDVAKRCGLSPSTVSGVLNNRTNTWASAETRQRIHEAAEALGYRPNQAARSLRTGKTFVVALIYHIGPPLQHLTFDGAAEIIAAYLGSQGYELKLHVYPSQSDLMSGLADLVRRQSCDAILLMGRESDVVEQGCFLEKHRVPFVVKGRHERDFPHWYQVDYDHERMMEVVVRHFHAQGHRRIAYIGYESGEVYQTHLIAGYREAVLQTLGALPAPDDIALTHPIRHPSITADLERWFTRPEEERPTAFAIGTGSNEWREIERFLALRHLHIGDGPGEIAVAGQTEAPLRLAFGTGWRFTDITYVSIAEIAVKDVLLPLLRNEEPPQPVHRILPELILVPSLGLPRC